MSPSAIWTIAFPVTGFMVGNVFLLTASTNSLLMNNCKQSRYLLKHWFLPNETELFKTYTIVYNELIIYNDHGNTCAKKQINESQEDLSITTDLITTDFKTYTIIWNITHV